MPRRAPTKSGGLPSAVFHGRDALCRQVDPGRLDAGQLRQRPLHRRDAGGALHPGHRQVGLARAVAEIAAGEPDLLQRGLGVPGCP